MTHVRMSSIYNPESFVRILSSIVRHMPAGRKLAWDIHLALCERAESGENDGICRDESPKPTYVQRKLQ